MSSKRIEYEVFTRIDRGSDLIHIGTVEAETVELAKVYANYTYDEEKWVEMFVVQRGHLITVRSIEENGVEEGVLHV